MSSAHLHPLRAVYAAVTVAALTGLQADIAVQAAPVFHVQAVAQAQATVPAAAEAAVAAMVAAAA